MTRFRQRRVVRTLVVSLLLAALVAPISAWASTPAAEECHGCCPEVIRAAELPDCCVVSPETPAAPLPVRVTSVVFPLTVTATAVVTWAQLPAPVDRPVTGDPPRRPMPVLLRTSILLI